MGTLPIQIVLSKVLLDGTLPRPGEGLSSQQCPRQDLAAAQAKTLCISRGFGECDARGKWRGEEGDRIL